MAPAAQECPICLDRFRDPVVTPCGHLSCEACMGTHVRASRNPYEATCPTCRAPFPIVTPNMDLIPKKYHVFISPSLRRVYMGDGEDTSRAVIEDLKNQVTVLKARVGTLKRDKELLMDRCEAAQNAAARLTADERAARIKLADAKDEVVNTNSRLKNLKSAYLTLESIHSSCPPDTKRKSGQAALDASTSIDSPGSSPSKLRNGRPVKPMPKRARLQPTTTGPTAQRRPPSIDLRASLREYSGLLSSSSSAPSSSTPLTSASLSAPSATSRPSVPIHNMRTRSRYTTSRTNLYYDSDGHSLDNLVPPYRTRSQSARPQLPINPLMRIERQRSTAA